MILKKIILWVGIIDNFAMVFVHSFFWKMYNWQDELPKLSNDTQAILQTENICFIFLFLYMAVMLFLMIKYDKLDVFAKAILVSVIGINVIRLITGFLFFGYSPTELISWIITVLEIAGYTYVLFMKENN